MRNLKIRKEVIIKMKKRLLAALMASAMALSMTACGSSGSDSSASSTGDSKKEDTSQSTNDTSQSTDDTSNADTPTEGGTDLSGKSFKVGVVQLVQHEALDAATEGFQTMLQSLLEADGATVEFDVQNASGDSANCATIVNGFVSSGVDLIMANATAALQAAQSGTKDIPILGTSVTDYATALDMDDWNGTTGTNISGTTDLAPLGGQADMVKELFPDAKNVGILYCSSEANSAYQVKTIKPILEGHGYTCTEYTFTDSNDVASVAEQAASANDVMYIPTDNIAASCTEAIKNVVVPAKVPVVAGEEGICKGCGVATLSISYNDLGEQTGIMAHEILANGKNPGEMPIEPAPNFTKKYNKSVCEELGITPPDDYEAIAEE